MKTVATPMFETILTNAPTVNIGVVEENYCPDCFDCDINCEECNS